jgi:DNA-binding phage protein
MPAKAPITLKREITELLASGNFGSRALILDDKDVRLLLRAAIEQEGSISAFARRHGLERSQLNKMLNGKRVVSRRVAKALGLGKVFTPNV